MLAHLNIEYIMGHYIVLCPIGMGYGPNIVNSFGTIIRVVIGDAYFRFRETLFI